MKKKIKLLAITLVLLTGCSDYIHVDKVLVVTTVSLNGNTNYPEKYYVKINNQLYLFTNTKCYVGDTLLNLE